MNKAIRDFKNNDISVEVKSAKELVELCNICEKFGIRHAKTSCYADEFKKLMNYA